MTYQIFKQRCNLTTSRLLILTSNKQVASQLNQEIESYQKVIQLIASETSNKIDNNAWNTVSNKSQRIRKTNLVNETDHLVIPRNTQ